jgi:hypothetical protein
VLPDGYLAFGAGPYVPTAVLPAETYLRPLRRLDCSDPLAVAAFITEFGMLATPYIDRWILPIEVRTELQSAFPSAVPSATNHWLDAAWYLRTVRALAGTWVAHQEATSLTEPWLAEGFDMPSDDEIALDQFVVSLNEGLKKFAFHVERRREYSGEKFTIGAPRIGLFSALCLQLMNAIAQGVVTRRCGNEACGQPFVHQLDGRADKVNRSRGVLRFCSTTCANQQYQREYRRRKAESK